MSKLEKKHLFNKFSVLLIQLQYNTVSSFEFISKVGYDFKVNSCIQAECY
jgi:hypothetical protein